MEKEFQWMIGPFVKSKAQNPCLMPKADTGFQCPLRKETVYWEPVEFWADGADCPVLQPVVMPTCFLEGLVYFKGKYYLYYGTADSKIALAQSE